jgi:hypothetical protein
MSREFDQLSERVIKDSKPADDRDPAEWQAWVQRWHRLIYRAGARAQLEASFGQVDDNALARLLWLSEHGVYGPDVPALVAEVEDWRAKGDALNSTYGMTDADLHSMISEGFHTAFRKATDSMEAAICHKAIRDMEPEEWGAIIDFVTKPIVRWLREAKAREEAAT